MNFIGPVEQIMLVSLCLSVVTILATLIYTFCCGMMRNKLEVNAHRFIWLSHVVLFYSYILWLDDLFPAPEMVVMTWGASLVLHGVLTMAATQVIRIFRFE